MPQVMIGLSARDYRTTNEVWRLAKRHLNPAVRRRIGWRGRSSFLRQLMLYGFEKASADPASFLRDVREIHDPLFGKRGRSEAGSDRRESMVSAWQMFFPSPSPPTTARRRSGKTAGPD
jgi:RNase adaptor protein for sRNA GlmZ degradation